jgi:hypothetical protein
MAGLSVLAVGLFGLSREAGPDRPWPILFCLALILSGSLDLLIWLVDLFKQRPGERIVILRRWLLLVKLLPLLLRAVAGLGLMLGS